MFCKKGVLKNFANFIGKHLCWSLSLESVVVFSPNAGKYVPEKTPNMGQAIRAWDKPLPPNLVGVFPISLY